MERPGRALRARGWSMQGWGCGGGGGQDSRRGGQVPQRQAHSPGPGRDWRGGQRATGWGEERASRDASPIPALAGPCCGVGAREADRPGRGDLISGTRGRKGCVSPGGSGANTRQGEATRTQGRVVLGDAQPDTRTHAARALQHMLSPTCTLSHTQPHPHTQSPAPTCAHSRV